MLSNSDKVREFSNGAAMASIPQEDGTDVAGKALPNTPTPANKKSVVFLTKMIIDELAEFLATVTSDGEERRIILADLVAKGDMRDDLTLTGDETESHIINEQADALVDIEYYSKDFGAKHGTNLDGIFDVVHGANMAKRDASGNFVKRSDGKVIKPAGWKAADTSVEIDRQVSEGAFK